MPYGVYLSAAGAHAQSHRMQVLSNNLANVDTPGFKPQQTILQVRFAEMIEEGITSPRDGRSRRHWRRRHDPTNANPLGARPDEEHRA